MFVEVEELCFFGVRDHQWRGCVRCGVGVSDVLVVEGDDLVVGRYH